MTRKKIALAAALSLALAAALGPLPAAAGLQRWDAGRLDAAGNPAAPGSGRPEAFAHDSRGYIVSIGCGPGGGHVMALTAPPDVRPDFAGPAIQPGLRISMPGTDLFSGSVAMRFDGRRYSGPVEAAVLEPLRRKIHNGALMLTELRSHTTVKLKLQSIERALGQVVCE